MDHLPVRGRAGHPGGGGRVLNWVLVGNLFGRRNFATLTGIISVFYSAGMMLTPLFLGWMVDRTGGYTESLLILTGLYAASAVLFAIARRPRPKPALPQFRLTRVPPVRHPGIGRVPTAPPLRS